MIPSLSSLPFGENFVWDLRVRSPDLYQGGCSVWETCSQDLSPFSTLHVTSLACVRGEGEGGSPRELCGGPTLLSPISSDGSPGTVTSMAVGTSSHALMTLVRICIPRNIEQLFVTKQVFKRAVRKTQDALGLFTFCPHRPTPGGPDCQSR